MSQKIVIPKLGGINNSQVIEVLVKVNQAIEKDAPLITLESDKASMDVPSPYAGTVESIDMKEGDTVSEGDVILTLAVLESEQISKPETKPKAAKVMDQPKKEKTKPQETEKAEDELVKKEDHYASPFVRRMAWELEIDLADVKGTGDGGRITLDDMKSFLLKDKPDVLDYTQWGPVTFESFHRIQSISGQHITRGWQTIPQVTQHHWVDITDLEAYRKTLKEKVTMVSFVMKALASAMLEHPEFCRGWVNEKEYALRQYIHIGFAVDTGHGLVVPVCQNVDKKSVLELAKEILELSEQGRAMSLKPEQLSGRLASVSSLGGIGGGHFTPIVTSPDVYVMGIARAQYQGVYQDDQWTKRLMLPLSLSYDHRLIDGALGARFLLSVEQALMKLAQG